ncbi:MAG: TIGR02530 family flagellar biosynthesis protein [Rhodothermales bacterium]
MNVRQLATRVHQGQEVHPRGRPPQGPVTPPEKRSEFASHLVRAREQAGLETTATRISQHAWQRIRQRGISMTDTEQRALGEAMQQLEAKGARDALLMRTDAAFVVNVPNRTVVTAIDVQEMQQRVFTQIDSAMLV